MNESVPSALYLAPHGVYENFGKETCVEVHVVIEKRVPISRFVLSHIIHCILCPNISAEK